MNETTISDFNQQQPHIVGSNVIESSPTNKMKDPSPKEKVSKKKKLVFNPDQTLLLNPNQTMSSMPSNYDHVEHMEAQMEARFSNYDFQTETKFNNMDKFSDAEDSEVSCSDSDPSDDNMEEHKL